MGCLLTGEMVMKASNGFASIGLVVCKVSREKEPYGEAGEFLDFMYIQSRDFHLL
jgi:hypothetical protein